MSTVNTIKGHMSVFLQSSTFVFATRMLGAAMGILIQLILARSIGGEQLGIVYIAMAIANIASVIAALGYPSVTVRFLRRYLTKENQDLAVEYHHQTHKEVWFFSVIMMIISALLIAASPYEMNDKIALYCGLLMIPAFAIISINGGLANALHRIDITYLPDIFIRPFFWMVLLIVPLIFGLTHQATSAVITATLATIIAGIIQFFWLRPILRTKKFDAPSKLNVSKSKLHKLWRWAALPMIAMTLLTNMIFDIDVVVLAFLLSKQELALFGMAFKIAFLIAFAVHVSQQSALPKIADAFTLKQHQNMRHEVVQCILVSAAASLISTIGVIILGKWALGFFGEEFRQAYITLVLLSLCSLIRALAGPVTQILVLAGKQKQILMIYGSGLLVLAALNVIAVPYMGIEGAALALIGATLYWSVFLNVTAFKAINMRTDALAADLFKYKPWSNIYPSTKEV